VAKATNKRALNYESKIKITGSIPDAIDVSAGKKEASSNNSIDEVLDDKSLKAKQKVVLISELLINRRISIEQLIASAKNKNDTSKATVLEAMEFASKTKAEIINSKAFEFVIDSLKSDAPRVKWESAKVMANTAHLFLGLLKKAIPGLLDNTDHSGNVVRWSAASALSKIIQCKTELNRELIPAIEAIEKREKDTAIKKIYQQGLKKASK
jgi:HEAT repeat protein